MFNKLIKVVLLIVLALSFSTINAVGVDAATVMWGKTELKLGQIGKATILRETAIVKLDEKGNMSVVKRVQKGEEYRVYSYQNKFGGLYGLGGGLFVQKNEAGVKYETPSKTKLALLSGKTPVVTLPTPKPVNPKPVPTPVKDKNAIYNEKIASVVNTNYRNYREYAEALYKIQSELNNEKDNFNGKYDLLMNFGNFYYNGGIEVDEMVFTFDNDVSLLAFKREPSSYNNNFPTNRSAILYNNEYYFDIGFIEKILSADLNMYYFDKLYDSTKYDGKFSQMGPSYQHGSEFKDESNKKLGAYNFVYLKNTVKDKTLTISQKEFPYNNLGMLSTGLSPYSNDEVKQILDIKFDVTYDSKNAILTIHFDKPSKEKSWIMNN